MGQLRDSDFSTFQDLFQYQPVSNKLTESFVSSLVDFPTFTTSDLIELLVALHLPFVTSEGFKRRFVKPLGRGGYAEVKPDDISSALIEALISINSDKSKSANKGIPDFDLRTVVAIKETRVNAFGTTNPGEPHPIITQAFVEISIMKHPRLAEHPNILNLFGVTENKMGLVETVFPPLFLVLELSQLGSMEAYIYHHPREIDWSLKRRLLGDVASGLQALHKYDVVHNDIKAQNVLLFFESTTDGERIIAKLADFGCAVPLALTIKMKRAAGTLRFAAPEAYFSDCDVRPSRDIYSLGLLMLHLIAEIPPFFDIIDITKFKTNPASVRNYVTQCVASTPLRVLLEPIASMLCAAPGRRLSDLNFVIGLLSSRLTYNTYRPDLSPRHSHSLKLSEFV